MLQRACACRRSAVLQWLAISAAAGRIRRSLPAADEPAREAYWPADVPRVVHLCFKTVEAVPAVVQSKWLSMNSGFQVAIHGDAECHQFLLANYGTEIAGYYRRVPGPIKADIWRVFYLYMHGGVYADVDVEPTMDLEHMLRPGEAFVSVGTNHQGLMNPIFLIARRHEPVLLHTMHRFLVQFRTTTYAYMEWSICKQLYVALAAWFEADAVAQAVWKRRIRGGAIPTTAATRLPLPNTTGEGAFLYQAADMDIPYGGTYRFFSSVLPSMARNELAVQNYSGSIWRMGELVPWTFRGQQLVMYDKWHRSLYQHDKFLNNSLCLQNASKIYGRREKNPFIEAHIKSYVRGLCANTVSHPNHVSRALRNPYRMVSELSI